MQAWDLIKALDPSVTPDQTKIHLAGFNGTEDPLDIYIDSVPRFQRWQCWQSQTNFKRRFVLTLIQMQKPDHWLFAGVYDSAGVKPDGDGYLYQLKERSECTSLQGRLIVNFKRTGRQSYLLADVWTRQMLVGEVRAERLSVPEFPGFKALKITKALLDVVVRENHETWRGAMSNVAAVYLISDPETGRFYVGSATGAGGLWQRWCEYAANGHGGNRDLKARLKEKGSASALQFSVLEIADTHTSEREILAREAHWKSVLLTRIHGFNAN